MSGLLQAYGRGLTTYFVAAVVAWALILIAVPQLTMLDKALRLPNRVLDSSVAAGVIRDARTCISILKSNLEAESEAGGTSSAISNPFASSTGSGSSGKTGLILQCNRATTIYKLVRNTGEPLGTLASLYGLPELSVDRTAPIAEQIAQAESVVKIVTVLHRRLIDGEATVFPYSGSNFAFLVSARAMPMTPQTKIIEDSKLANRFYSLVGLRFESNGVVQMRLSLITIVRTIIFAMIATVLALVICYPVAFNIAIASGPRKAGWLLLSLIIPYAIVELMRIYAWVSLIENRGFFNHVLDWVGLIDLENGEGIPFKRSPITVFVVIVYTYILFMMFPIVNVMSTLDKNQLEAGRDLGSSNWRLHWRIVIPHTKPGIAVGCITTFMLAAGAFSVPRIISRGLQAEWFSQTIYNKFFESENSNLGAAYSFAFTIICFAIVALFMWIMKARLKDFIRA